jgi:hypothetical protein
MVYSIGRDYTNSTGEVLVLQEGCPIAEEHYEINCPYRD